MTRDDIIRMAREADSGFEGGPDADGTLVDSLIGLDAIERFAALVAAEERKALKDERRKDMFEICSLRESEESLREEVERLRDELRQGSIDHTRAEVERLREEIAALRTDAERYRWLRENKFKHNGHCLALTGPILWETTLDAAVDAAMKQPAPQGETAIWSARHDPRE